MKVIIKMKPTGQQTHEGFIGGKMKSQLQAALILPVLVRQAQAKRGLTYKELADELGLFHRLGRQLGYIGGEIEKLSAKWGSKIPPIQCLVVNQVTRQPGNGVAWFVGKDEFLGYSKEKQKLIMAGVREEIFNYSNWINVLKECKLTPLSMSFPQSFIAPRQQYGRGGIESPQHKRLKEYVSQNPQLFGLPRGTKATIEFLLKSGDEIDVLFKTDSLWVGVEVKSELSSDDDIERGIFQCVKYEAVLNAMHLITSKPIKTRIYLVLQTDLPPQHISYKNALG